MLYNLLQSMDQWLDSLGLYSFLQVLYQREFRAFTAVIVAFFIVIFLGKPMIRWLIRMKIGDRPEFNHEELNALMASKHANDGWNLADGLCSADNPFIL
jgi:hypothetical protein